MENRNGVVATLGHACCFFLCKCCKKFLFSEYYGFVIKILKSFSYVFAQVIVSKFIFEERPGWDLSANHNDSTNSRFEVVTILQCKTKFMTIPSATSGHQLYQLFCDNIYITWKHMLQVPYANPIVSQYMENLEKTHWEAVKGLLILISLVTTLGGDLDSVCVCLISFLVRLVGKLFCRLQLLFCLLRRNTCLLLKLWRRHCG